MVMWGALDLPILGWCPVHWLRGFTFLSFIYLIYTLEYVYLKIKGDPIECSQRCPAPSGFSNSGSSEAGWGKVSGMYENTPVMANLGDSIEVVDLFLELMWQVGCGEVSGKDVWVSAVFHTYSFQMGAIEEGSLILSVSTGICHQWKRTLKDELKIVRLWYKCNGNRNA